MIVIVLGSPELRAPEAQAMGTLLQLLLLELLEHGAVAQGLLLPGH